MVLGGRASQDGKVWRNVADVLDGLAIVIGRQYLLKSSHKKWKC